VGAVALVAGWAARICDPDARIAAVFPDGPHRYFDTIYNDDYCSEHGLLAGPPLAEPESISYASERSVSRWTRCSEVVDPVRATRADESRAEVLA
jgi:cysteine synthase A